MKTITCSAETVFKPETPGTTTIQDWLSPVSYKDEDEDDFGNEDFEEDFEEDMDFEEDDMDFEDSLDMDDIDDLEDYDEEYDEIDLDSMDEDDF